ncbi:hypothetical protein RHMOL_Rhmol04G0216900 [Rhododendron molle]|uniref:Uncharacterized protein n=1 Tax=Rhododendron molle TaxID=49168 RepID=A0ACC0P458_RHOML|nr:hypothetical protein RHMOL_Rhmol04G0216900 [Rhododendron molle]
MGTRSGGTIVSMCVSHGNPERRTMVRYGLVICGEEPMLMCANGNPERRNHCAYTREPRAAEPRLSHGVTFGDPDILCLWRRWYNVSDLLDKQGELYTLEAFGAEELARMEQETEL